MALLEQDLTQLRNHSLTLPPPGAISNPEHPVWHGQPVLISGSIGLFAMLIMASIRFYVKCYIPSKWVLDDSVFALSLSAGISLVALQVAAVTGGAFGYHSWDVTFGDFTKEVLLRALTVSTAAPLLIWIIKLALYSLIFHAFQPLRYIRWLVYIGVIFSFCFYLATAVVNAITCGPRGGTDLEAYLAGSFSEQCSGRTSLFQAFSIASGVVNLANDIYLLILPLPAILKLNMALRKKFGVMLIFLAGIMACIMSIVGLIYRIRCRPDQDETYKAIPLYVLTTTEYSVGIMIPCMAACAKFFTQCLTSCKSYLASNSFVRVLRYNNENQKEHVDIKRKAQHESEIHTDTIDKMLARMFPGQDLTESMKTEASLTCESDSTFIESYGTHSARK